MYVPEVFAVADEAYAREVIDGHGFALLVTAADGPPQASHLPFLLAPEHGPRARLSRTWRARTRSGAALNAFRPKAARRW